VSSQKISNLTTTGSQLYKDKTKGKIVSHDEKKAIVNEIVDMLQVLYKDSNTNFNDSEKKLIKTMMYVNIISKDNDLEIKQIVSKDHKEWMLQTGQPRDKNRELFDYNHWKRFKAYISTKQGINTSKFEEQVRVVLRNMPDPQNYDESWLSRGLVVGNVQSGKTTNYIGLMNKAVDVGYKIIIVLAGATNDLRKQTQIRIEEGFTGKNSLSKSKIGVSLAIEDDKNDYRSIQYYTTRDEKGDFSEKVQQHINISENWSKDEPCTLFVIKKTKSVLENLEKFLLSRTDEGKKIPSPLLLIDDECDYASIDTSKIDDDNKEFDATTINKLIRKIMHRFERTSYVGYTATPYGNIFIETEDEDGNPKNDEKVYDLFPDNFIINLGSNDVYSGPMMIFPVETEDNLNFHREVPQLEWEYFSSIIKTKNKILRDSGLDVKTHQQERKSIYTDIVDKCYEDKESLLNINLTKMEEDGLTQAVRSFIISTAVRNLRGYPDEFNTMLIHVNRENVMQNFLKRIVDDIYGKIETEVLNQDFDKFQSLYYNDYIIHTNEYLSAERIPDVLKEGIEPLDNCDFTFNDVCSEIIDMVQRKQILTIVHNSKNKESHLSYEDKDRGTYYICIGGDILSRGFTVEGLSVSYFLRHSKAQDTLLQMGRWFGYRVGYLDLCRVFTTNAINDDFTFTTMAQKELFDTFTFMEQNSLTPREFGLKIANARGTLQVTGFGKRRRGTDTKIDFTEFYQYGKWMKIDDIDYNSELLRNFVNNRKQEILKEDTIRNHTGGFLTKKTLSNYKVFDISKSDMFDFLDKYKLNTIKNSRGYITKSTLSSALGQVLSDHNNHFKLIINCSDEKTVGNGYSLFENQIVYPRKRNQIDNFIENGTIVSGKAMTIPDDKSIAKYFNAEGYSTLIMTLHYGFDYKDQYQSRKTSDKDANKNIKSEIVGEMEAISIDDKINQKDIFWGYDKNPVIYYWLKLPRYDILQIPFENAFVSYIANEVEAKMIDDQYIIPYKEFDE